MSIGVLQIHLDPPKDEGGREEAFQSAWYELKLAQNLIKKLEEERQQNRRRLAKRTWKLRRQLQSVTHTQRQRMRLQNSSALAIQTQVQYQAIISQANRDCLSLVFQILQDCLIGRSELLEKLLERQILLGLEKLSNEARIELSIHPEDQPVLRRLFPELPFSVRHDETLGRGNMLLESPSTRLEFRWQEQLRELQQCYQEQMSRVLEKNTSTRREPEHASAV